MKYLHSKASHLVSGILLACDCCIISVLLVLDTILKN